MKILGIIPARYNSSRFPGKPLAEIGGKSMIQRVYEQAKKCELLSAVFVATDDDRIHSHIKTFGGNSCMTGEHHSGTDRCNEVARKIDGNFDVIINIQGDEPFINPEQIAQVASLFADQQTEIATLAKPITNPEEIIDENVVKVYFDNQFFATNFTRKHQEEYLKTPTIFKHIGIYGYRKPILQAICQLPQSKREVKERLEQLRWLENGCKIKLGITAIESHAVDVPKDIEKLKRLHFFV